VNRPDYIARGGDLAFAPPLALRGATSYAFLVSADLDALSRLCDDQLNAVSAPTGTIYKPLLPMAAFVCADITQAFSTSPPDSQKGWIVERDFGVWIPVVAGTMVGDRWQPGRICWYLPYVFVDNVAAMITGREVYGFFKQIAALTMPNAPSAPGMFAIDALVIPSFAPSAQAQTLRLVTITSTESTPAPAAPPWTGLRDTADALWGRIKDSFFTPVHGLAVLAWDIIENLLEDLVTGDVPMVFLKQFRDAADPTKACYQAVVEAPAHVDAFVAAGLTHPHAVAILPCASHPIVAECGLAGHALRAELGFWYRVDFTMQPGRVIAEAP
jgi:hypothetical protein